MLKKLANFCIVLLLSTGFLYAQADVEFVTVKGKALNANDSTAIPSSTIFYEKLPYYDDMGMTKSSPDGSFEFHLAKGTKYIFRIEGIPGFQLFEEEITIESGEGLSETSLNLMVRPEELEELIRLDNLNFNRGSATIMSSSFSSLDDFIIYINERPGVVIQLEGHTDFAGNAEANMRLSQARVESVAEYLSKNGVKKSRITTKAFGGTQPLTTERTDQAKLMNRRVEVRLIRQN